ncbi:MAG: hypothetical protein AAF974_12570 [Cyanobacteria bacterium P01_E01_bin.34]
MATTTLGLAICLLVLLFAPTAMAAELVLDGDSYGESWRAAAPAEKLEYCRYAFSAFRSAPSTSYVISSNVQDISPEGFCTRLDQFYGFEVNLDTPLSEAAAIAPLLFADVSMDFEVNQAP